MQVVGEAADGRDAVVQTRALKPDVILMDIAMPLLNGLEATKQIHRDNPNARVLVLTMYESDEYVAQMLQAGATGYVLKKVAGSELIHAIRAVEQGEAFLYPSITKRLVEEQEGQISIENKAGQGAQFTILIPALQGGKRHP
jgi:DNA-binding NarL/FixJ family response regulator